MLEFTKLKCIRLVERFSGQGNPPMSTSSGLLKCVREFAIPGAPAWMACRPENILKSQCIHDQWLETEYREGYSRDVLNSVMDIAGVIYRAAEQPTQEPRRTASKPSQSKRTQKRKQRCARIGKGDEGVPKSRRAITQLVRRLRRMLADHKSTITN